MTVSNAVLNISAKAGEDLSDSRRGLGMLYKAIDVTSGMVANASGNASGLLTQTAPSGVGITTTFLGQETFVAGAAIAANADMMVTTSGYLITVTSGGLSVGRNLFSAVSSGEEGRGLFNFATPTYQAT